MTPETFAAKVSELEDELARVIVGQQDLVRSVLLGLLSEGHVLLEGVPGLGKTLLLRSLGDALGVGIALLAARGRRTAHQRAFGTNQSIPSRSRRAIRRRRHLLFD